jgi:uncharacterized YccA/Bax inhibitor family protein
MANPILNDKTWNKAARDPGWGAPDPSTRGGLPINDGPTSPWRGNVMTVGGTISAAGVLMVILLAAATVGWQMGPDNSGSQVGGFPALALGGILVGFACVIAIYFRPMWAKFLAPVYAVGEGFFLGVISKAYENYQNGIVVQAVGATLGVFAVMLFLYKTKIIKVTDRFRRIVITATMGLMVFYLFSFVLNLFGSGVPFLQSASPLGIGFSLFAAGLAAMNLAIDFDFIEKGARQGLPKGMEWFAAFALVITLVWLYLELLRLLSKLQRR